MSDLIDVGPLQAAFLRSGVTASEVCHRMQWFRPDGGADTSRFKRAVGLLPNTDHGQTKCARRIGIDRAALIADALNVDPFEVGL